MFGDFYYCCSLSLLPQLACSIHETWPGAPTLADLCMGVTSALIQSWQLYTSNMVWRGARPQPEEVLTTVLIESLITFDDLASRAN